MSHSRVPQPCGANFRHDPHDYGKTGIFTCPGVTSQQEAANRMRVKAARDLAHSHMVEAHGLTRLSPRSFSANRSLWEQVHRALHKASGTDA